MCSSDVMGSTPAEDAMKSSANNDDSCIMYGINGKAVDCQVGMSSHSIPRLTTAEGQCRESGRAQSTWTRQSSSSMAYILFVFLSIVSVASSQSKELVVYDALAPVCDVAMFVESDRFPGGFFMFFSIMLAMVSFILGTICGCGLASCFKPSVSSQKIAMDKTTQLDASPGQTTTPMLWVTETGQCYHKKHCRALTDSRRELRPCKRCQPSFG